MYQSTRPRLQKVVCPLFLLAVFTGVSTQAYATPIEVFLDRVQADNVQFVGIDPTDLGNPDAAPLELAQVQDTDGTLGHISANSPGFWRWVGKGLMIVGGSGAGALGGAAVGSAVPGLGTAAGAIVGGIAGAATSVGGAIVANTKCGSPCLTQDVAIYDEIVIETLTGDFDVLSALIGAVIGNPVGGPALLPGGGLLITGDSSIIPGSSIFDEFGNPKAGGEIQLGVFDADGNFGTNSDQTLGVFYQDLVEGIGLNDEISIFLDNIVSPSLLTDGDPIRSRYIFGQALPEPALAGDLDGDGFVGIADLNIVLSAWNQLVPPGDPLADVDGDGFVGIADLNVVLGNWNAGTPPAAGSVPEPATLTLFALTAVALLRRSSLKATPTQRLKLDSRPER